MTGTAEGGAGPPGLAGPRAEKWVSLALQGGGAHGAFTWGVLDRLIEDGRIAFEAITGASAGSMNAVVMTDGWMEGGPDGARSQLAKFWQRVSIDGGCSGEQRQAMDAILSFWAPVASNPVVDFWRGTLSPAESNPLDINPLREVLDELVDFARLRTAPVRLFVSATNVRTGKIRIFGTEELDSDRVMASACLPTVFRTVEIDGEPYWDGGYMGNPALYPLFYSAAADDVLLVQINPIERHEVPTSRREIENRLTEITFNGGLLRELRVIDFVGRLIDENKLSGDRYKRVLMHRIDGGPAIDRYSAGSRLRAEWDFFRELRDLGREAAEAWLAANYAAIGERATLDLRGAYA